MGKYPNIATIAAASTLLCMLAAPANASEAQAAPVGDLNITNTNNGFFKTTGTRTAQPSCATLPRWSFPLSTARGQAILALLLTAKATGKTVYVLGTGSCLDDPLSESIQDVKIIG